MEDYYIKQSHSLNEALAQKLQEEELCFIHNYVSSTWLSALLMAGTQ